jgi:hypothetical protein
VGPGRRGADAESGSEPSSTPARSAWRGERGDRRVPSVSHSGGGGALGLAGPRRAEGGKTAVGGEPREHGRISVIWAQNQNRPEVGRGKKS